MDKTDLLQPDSLPLKREQLSAARQALLKKRLRGKAQATAATRISPRPPGQGHPPLSFAQERMWFLDQLIPDSPGYNISMAVQMQGPLDVPSLQRSLNALVQRHETLRTTFGVEEGQPVQRIAETLSRPLPMIDLQSLPASERLTEVQHRIAEEALCPINLARGPLFRAALLKATDREHVLLLTMHHIISDGWSLGVFIRELVTLYDGFSADQPVRLPDLPIQYADFSYWQRQHFPEATLTPELEYWKQQLTDAPTTLELPTDRPRPPVMTFNGAIHRFLLPPTLTEAIKGLSQREEATLFMTLLAAFQALLYLYSGQDDITIGSPLAHRTRMETEGLIGCFINPLPFRTNLAGNPTFRELLRRVRAVCLGAYAHQDLPLEMLVNALQRERSVSRMPLFQVMFILQNAPMPALHSASGLSLRPLEVDNQVASFDLTLTMVDTAEGLLGLLEYNTDLFDPGTIERLIAHFRNLLSGAVANPEQRLLDLPLLTPAERDWLLEASHANRVQATEATRGIHHLVEEQAARTPNATAVIFEAGDSSVTRQLTYAELDQRANQLAHRLRAAGIQAEKCVGLYLERSPEMLVAILGVLKAGGAYVPLDPLYSRERLLFALEDSRFVLLVTQSHLIQDLPPEAREVNILCLDRNEEETSTLAKHPPESGIAADNLAYVIYTSGSTGKPKGVMVTHRSLVNAYRDWEEAYLLRTTTTCHLQMASLAFDVFTGDWVRALCSGATLVICPQEILLSPETLYELMRRHRVDCAEFVPVVLRGLIQYVQATDQSLDFMQLLVVGSDIWYVQDQAAVQQRCGSLTRLINSYGLTETTIDSSFYDSASPVESSSGIVPIGRPFPNTQLYVLGPQLQLLPIGIPGELYIGGPGLARGYLHNAELTAERFIPNPFSREPGARLYRTGDVVRCRPNGTVEIFGRADDQVKLRGFRIELGEIEAALRRHPEVSQAVAAVREDQPGERRLAAYVVPRPGSELSQLSSQHLREFLKGQVPDYMLPSAFGLLTALPQTPNGKVDRRALPAPDPAQRRTDYVPPRTPIEIELAHLWSQLLNAEQVGLHDNFFELGGHSLLATQLISRLRKTFHVDLPLRMLFETSTVIELAEAIAQAQGHAEANPLPPIDLIPREWRRVGISPRGEVILRGTGDNGSEGEVAFTAPLSFAQQRLWILDQLQSNDSTYTIPTALRVSGPLNVAALEHSLNEIVRRHEVFRTRFATLNGEPVQVVVPALSIRLPIIDLSALPELDQETEARHWVWTAVQRPFNLSTGPLLQTILLSRNPTEHIAVLVMHHIISDGWSIGILIRELASLYLAYSAGQSPALPELPIQYADFAQWQARSLQGEVLETQLAYWKRQLDNSPLALALPTDRPRPALTTFNGAVHPIHISRPLTEALKALSLQETSTLFTTLLAAFKVLLNRYSGQEDMVVGSPIAGRTRTETEGLIGFFVNTLVLRSDLSGDPTFRELLRRVHEVTLQAQAHQDLPFEKLVLELHPLRDLSRHPLFQVMFVLQNAPLGQVELPQLVFRPLETETHTAKFDLTLIVSETPEGLQGAFEYNTDLFEANTLSRLGTHFLALLKEIATDPDRPISTLPLLPEAERQRLLIEWNDTAISYPRNQCLPELFEAQVERTPEADAIVFGDQRLSYRELNDRANQLATYLRAQGVGPEVRVGICIERSLEMMIGLLGVLKAGGVYVPLDPAYPRERLGYMLEDSQASVLLTQSRLLAVGGWQLATTRGDQLSVICLDTEWETITSRQRPAASRQRPAPESLAYLIYTSGSTGRPKGVAITHRSAVTFLYWARDVFAPEQLAGVLASTSICFDLSIFELFAPLSWGGKVILAEHALVLPTLPATNEVTLINTVPSAMAQLLEMGGVPPSVRVVNLAGEPLANALVQKIYELETIEQVFNLYGPTEDTTYSTFTLLPKGSDESPTVGRPIANTQVYLLDKHLQPVPIGVPGELYLGGQGLARGYLNRPELTAEKFVPNPFVTTKDEGRRTKVVDPWSLVLGPSSRLYRTGDLARYLPDGRIDFLGRIDHQVKVRGFRIELGEIESALRQHPAVHECVVLAREDSPGGVTKRLVAYVVAQPETTPTVSELRAFLKESLPEYMIPTAFMLLEKLPLTLNGKINRQALPAPDGLRPTLEVVYLAPQTEMERALASIWQDVLHLEKVGVHDNFFDLGGHSLLVIQVYRRLQTLLGDRELPIVELFRFPTISTLAAYLSQAPAASASLEKSLERAERRRERTTHRRPRRTTQPDQVPDGQLESQHD